MNERDIIFRDRLIAIISELGPGGSQAKDKSLRRTVGSYAKRMAREAGARDWGDLKERADGATYDSALQLFQKQSEAAQRSGNAADVRAFEVLGLSLIARRQEQPDLRPGIVKLDEFIRNCESEQRRSIEIVTPRPSH